MTRVDEPRSNWLPLIALPGAAAFFALATASLVPEHVGARVTPTVPARLASAPTALASSPVRSAAEQSSALSPRVVAARPAPNFGRRGFSPRLERDEPVQELELPPPGASGAILNQGQPWRPVSAPVAVMVAGSGTAAVASSPPAAMEEARER